MTLGGMEEGRGGGEGRGRAISRDVRPDTRQTLSLLACVPCLSHASLCVCVSQADGRTDKQAERKRDRQSDTERDRQTE